MNEIGTNTNTKTGTLYARKLQIKDREGAGKSMGLIICPTCPHWRNTNMFVKF